MNTHALALQNDGSNITERNEMNLGSGLLSGPSSSSGPVDMICDDGFEDACSICLEPFTSSDPPSVTNCKHEYHLHCILEWSQRRIECPICSQHLVLEDPASQELLAGVESDRNLRLRHSVNLTNEENGFSNDAPNVDESDLEHRIMRHLAAFANKARSISRRRRQMAPAVGPSQILPSSSLTNTPSVIQPEHHNPFSCFLDAHSVTSARAPTVTQPDSSAMFPSSEVAPSHTAENLHFLFNPSQSPSDNPGRSSSSEFVAFSESLKSKISTASTRYKESISKSTRGLKEKLIARNDSVKELSRGVQREMSAGIAGISRMIERLDITHKRAAVSVPLSSCTMGTSNTSHEIKGIEDGRVAQSLYHNTGGTSNDMNLDSSPLITTSNSEVVEVSLAKGKN